MHENNNQTDGLRYGDLLWCGLNINKGQLAVLNFGEQLEVITSAHTKFIFVSGKPIGKPVEQ